MSTKEFMDACFAFCVKCIFLQVALLLLFGFAGFPDFYSSIQVM